MAYILLVHHVLLCAFACFQFRPVLACLLEHGCEGGVQELPVLSQTTSILRRAAVQVRSPTDVPDCVWNGHCLGDSCQTSNHCDNDWVCGTQGHCIEVDADTPIAEASTISPAPTLAVRDLEPAVLSASNLIIDTVLWPTPTSLNIQAPSMSSSPSSTMAAASGGLDNAAVIGLAVAVPFSVITMFGALIIVFKARRRRLKQQNSFRYPPFDKISSPQSTIIHRLHDTDGALDMSPQRPPRLPTDMRTFTYVPIGKPAKPMSIYYPKRSTNNHTRSTTPSQASLRAETLVRTPRAHTPLRPDAQTPEMREKPRFANLPPPLPPPKDAGHTARRPLAPRRLRSSPGGLYALNLVDSQHNTTSPISYKNAPPSLSRPNRQPSIHKIASSPDVRTDNLVSLRPFSPTIATRLPATPELQEPGMRPAPLKTKQSHQNMHAPSPSSRSTPKRDTRSTLKSSTISPLKSSTHTYPTLQNTPATPLNVQESPSLLYPYAAELEGCDAQKHLPDYRHKRYHHPDEASDILDNYNTPSWRSNFTPHTNFTQSPLSPSPGASSPPEFSTGLSAHPTGVTEPTPSLSSTAQEVPIRMDHPIPDDSPTLPRHLTWFNTRVPSPLGRVANAVRSASAASSRSLTRTLSRKILHKKMDVEHDAALSGSSRVTSFESSTISSPVSPDTSRGERVPIKHSPVSALTPDGREHIAWPVPAMPRRVHPEPLFEEVEDIEARRELERMMTGHVRGKGKARI